MPVRTETIGDATLYLGDCYEVVQTLHDLNARCAVVTDPPYGQAYKVNTFYSGGTRENAVVQRNGKTLKVRPKVYKPIVGDDRPFDPMPWTQFGSECLMWGAHKFADRLPPGGWLIWDKVPTGKVRDQGDGEAAWISGDRPLRIYRLLWDGLCVGVGARHEVTNGQQRLHPAQKPEALMAWCLTFVKADCIFDPFMGAGSTGVAAIKAGRQFVGCEIVPEYFEIACERIAAAWAQPRLFQDERVARNAGSPQADDTESA